jgi:translation initiation factor 1 (eIF-1/SUI1)
MAEQHINLVDRTDEDTTMQPTEQPPATPDSHIDILFENQRGWFVFGIPLFSANALWNLKIDQAPWVDAKFKPSAVNITNAQVPDPSWVWDWKSWYVDMSHDVDEEGWQYSLWFRGAAWHGNHPWFHSFVRRRCWLRKRVKQKLPPKTKDNRDRLFGDTFSIGTTLARISTVGTASLEDSKEQSVEEEVKDIATLMRILRKSAIDREKIVAITRFIDEADEELHYLAEQVSRPPHSACTMSDCTLDTFYHVYAGISKLPPPPTR